MASFTYPNIGTMPPRVLALLLQGLRVAGLDFWLRFEKWRGVP